MQKISTKFRWDHPQLGRQMEVEYVKIAFFDRSRGLRLRRLTAEFFPSATVVRVHDGVLVDEYVGYHGSMFITRTVHFNVYNVCDTEHRMLDVR